jgi:hypothetical protein
MRPRLGLVVLGALMMLTGLSAFGTGTVLAPTKLRAQGCGAFNGKKCASDCTRECSDGSCCGWSYYYYSTNIQ